MTDDVYIRIQYIHTRIFYIKSVKKNVGQTHLNSLVKIVVGIHVQSGEIPDDIELKSHLYRRPVTHRVVFPSDPIVMF